MRNHKGQRRAPIAVLVAGSSGLVSRHVCSVLRRVPRERVSLLDEALARDAPVVTRPSIVVIDEALISGSPVAYLERLTSQLPSSRPIIVGNEQPSEALWQYLLHGVRGFVRYEYVQRDLARAIETVWAGGMWVSRKTLALFAEHVSRLSQSKQHAQQVFTTRETMVLKSLAQGLTNKELSAALGISEATVKFHLKNIFAKLAVHGRHAAVKAAKSGHMWGGPYGLGGVE